MKNMSASFAVLFVLVASISTPLAAQVFPTLGDDNFDDPAATCCDTVVPNFPGLGVLPALTVTGEYGVLDACANIYQLPVSVTVTPTLHPGVFLDPLFLTPAGGQQACDEIAFFIEVKDPATPSQLGFTIGTATPLTTDRSSFALGKFMRTWTTVDPGPQGVIRQHWRFLVSGDAVFAVLPSSGGLYEPPCQVNSLLAGPFPAAGFFGVIDYSFAEKETGLDWRVSLSLSHHHGLVSHLDTPLNPRALASVGGVPSPFMHANCSYNLVAPGGFVFGAAKPPASTFNVSSALDALRNTISDADGTAFPAPPSPGFTMPECLREDHMVALSTNATDFCPATGQGGVGNFIIQTWDAPFNFATCGPSTYPWYTVPVTPYLPAGFEQEFLGSWPATARSDVASVALTSVVATIVHEPSCQPVPYPDEHFHICFGTNSLFDLTQGNAPVLFGPQAGVTDMLLDFGNNVERNSYYVPQAGEPGYTSVLWMISR